MYYLELFKKRILRGWGDVSVFFLKEEIAVGLFTADPLLIVRRGSKALLRNFNRLVRVLSSRDYMKGRPSTVLFRN